MAARLWQEAGWCGSTAAWRRSAGRRQARGAGRRRVRQAATRPRSTARLSGGRAALAAARLGHEHRFFFLEKKEKVWSVCGLAGGNWGFGPFCCGISARMCFSLASEKMWNFRIFSEVLPKLMLKDKHVSSTTRHYISIKFHYFNWAQNEHTHNTWKNMPWIKKKTERILWFLCLHAHNQITNWYYRVGLAKLKDIYDYYTSGQLCCPFPPLPLCSMHSVGAWIMLRKKKISCCSLGLEYTVHSVIILVYDYSFYTKQNQCTSQIN